MTLKGDVIAGWTGGVYARMGPIAWGHVDHLGFQGPLAWGGVGEIKGKERAVCRDYSACQSPV